MDELIRVLTVLGWVLVAWFVIGLVAAVIGIRWMRRKRKEWHEEFRTRKDWPR